MKYSYHLLHTEASVCAGLVAQSCPSLCYPLDCRPPGSSVHGIFQARIREWVAVSFSNRSERHPQRNIEKINPDEPLLSYSGVAHLRHPPGTLGLSLASALCLSQPEGADHSSRKELSLAFPCQFSSGFLRHPSSDISYPVTDPKDEA